MILEKLTLRDTKNFLSSVLDFVETLIEVKERKNTDSKIVDFAETAEDFEDGNYS